MGDDVGEYYVAQRLHGIHQDIMEEIAPSPILGVLDAGGDTKPWTCNLIGRVAWVAMAKSLVWLGTEAYSSSARI